MAALRFVALAVLAAAVLAVTGSQTAGQGTPKAKPKPGAPFVNDPADLIKVGTPLNGWALVQRPAALNKVRSWSIETKKHRWTVTNMVAHPSGKKFATGGYDGIIRIWDATTGQFQRALVGHEGSIGGMAWSPDGKYLAAAGYYSVYVWDDVSGLPVRILRGKYGASLVAWSPDGQRLLTGGGGSGQIAIWDVATKKLQAETEFGQPVGGIAFAPSGENVAAAASRAGTYISDALKLKTVHTFKEMLDNDYAVGFSPDGKKLAAGSAKQTVIYDADSGAVIKKIATPGLALTWTPKGDLLIANASYVITPHVGAGFLPGKPLLGVGSALSLSADGTQLFGLYGNQVTHWDLEKGTVVRTVTVGESQNLNVGPTTSLLVTSPTPVLWDVVNDKRIGGLDDHKGGIVTFAWGPTGKTLALAAGDNKIRVFDPATAKLLRTLTSPAAVVALALTADGRVACSSADKKVTLWGGMGDLPIQTLSGFANAMPILAWSRDGQYIATARDKEISVWTAGKGANVKTLEHPRPVNSLLWSLDNGRLLVGSSEEVALSAYLASTWKLQPALDKGTAYLGCVASQWSSDGVTLLGYRSSGIQQWNGKTGKQGVVVGSVGPAYTISFWPDGRTLAAGCGDRAARYWDVAGRFRFTAIAEKEHLVTVSAEGHYRCPEAIETELVAVVYTDKGQETVTLKELGTKFGFKNVPTNVK